MRTERESRFYIAYISQSIVFLVASTLIYVFLPSETRLSAYSFNMGWVDSRHKISLGGWGRFRASCVK